MVVVTYKAGFVAKKVEKKVFCEQCSAALFSTGDEPTSNDALVDRKDRGGLGRPSKTVVDVC